MPTINFQEVRRKVQLDGIDAARDHLLEALREKWIKPEDFSIKGLFEATVVNAQGEQVGHDVLSECFDPKGPQKNFSMRETAGAVSSGAFSQINGQVLYNKFLESYKSENFVFTGMIPTVSTQLDGERIAGITDIGDQAQIVAEGDTYPLAGVGPDWIDTPPTIKRGVIVPVTKEAIFFDRTGLLLQRAGKVGEALGINKEKRAISCIVDENTTAHRYKWRGTTIATYGDSSGAHNWDNLAASNALVDWTDIDAAEQLFAAMVDPNTGEPIMVNADTIIVTPELYNSAARTINATLISLQAGGFATSGNLFRTDAPNPVGSGPFSSTYKIVTSRLLPVVLGTNTSWFLGNPTKAFAYMENWPITVTQAPANSEEEFQRDIVFRVKASERGAYATMDPRLMVKSTA